MTNFYGQNGSLLPRSKFYSIEIILLMFIKTMANQGSLDLFEYGWFRIRFGNGVSIIMPKKSRYVVLQKTK